MVPDERAHCVRPSTGCLFCLFSYSSFPHFSVACVSLLLATINKINTRLCDARQVVIRLQRIFMIQRFFFLSVWILHKLNYENVRTLITNTDIASLIKCVKQIRWHIDPFRSFHFLSFVFKLSCIGPEGYFSINVQIEWCFGIYADPLGAWEWCSVWWQEKCIEMVQRHRNPFQLVHRQEKSGKGSLTFHSFRWPFYRIGNGKLCTNMYWQRNGLQTMEMI